MDYLERIESFITNVGFPISCVLGVTWLVYRAVSKLWEYFVPKSDAVINAVCDFLKTTSSSVSKQTEILLVMSGVQREHGDILNQIIERGERARHLQELENDHCGRSACPVSDFVPDLNRH